MPMTIAWAPTSNSEGHAVVGEQGIVLERPQRHGEVALLELPGEVDADDLVRAQVDQRRPGTARQRGRVVLEDLTAVPAQDETRRTPLGPLCVTGTEYPL